MIARLCIPDLFAALSFILLAAWELAVLVRVGLVPELGERTMYGLNAVALLFSAASMLLAYRLCKGPEGTRKKVIRGFFRRNRKQYRKFASSKQNVLPREAL